MPQQEKGVKKLSSVYIRRVNKPAKTLKVTKKKFNPSKPQCCYWQYSTNHTKDPVQAIFSPLTIIFSNENKVTKISVLFFKETFLIKHISNEICQYHKLPCFPW